MFGTWISQIQADLRKEFPATTDYKPADFMREPMPASVGHFLDHALTRRAAMVKVSVDSAWFDVLDQDVIESEKRWRETLVSSARYPAAVWGQSIDQAVAHVVSFLVSPADSFCDFVFANSDADAHPLTVLQRLIYFRPYSSLRDVVREYAERRGSEPVSKEDLRIAILKADRSIVANYEPADWIALLRPLYDLASVTVVGDGVPEVPTSLLKSVFEAKAADDLVRRIEAVESVGGRRKLTESSLLTVIGPTEVAPIAAPSAETIAAPFAAPESLRLNDMHVPPSTKRLPRWMQFTPASSIAESQSSHSGDGGPGTPSQPAPSADERSEQGGIPMPSRIGERALLPDDLVSTETGSGGAPQMDLPEGGGLAGIDPVRRAWFVNNLFDGNFEDFSRVISLLSGAGDWEAAAHVIGAEVFERHNVDIYSQPAIEFTNAVESMYQ